MFEGIDHQLPPEPSEKLQPVLVEEVKNVQLALLKV